MVTCFNPWPPPWWPTEMGGRAHPTRGFSLLEVTVAVAIFTVTMGMLFTLSLGIGDAARIQDARIIAQDEARRAILSIAPRLRQAARSSINFDEFPTDVLVFRMPADLDGNGLAVDAFNAIELGPEIEIRRDQYDLNKDGLTMAQLIMVSGESVRVLANNLVTESEGGAPENAGFRVEEEEGAIRVTVRTREWSRRGHELRQVFSQAVFPRN